MKSILFLILLAMMIAVSAVSQDQTATFHQDVRWSPDGKKIVYVEGRFPKTSIYVADADGSDPRKIVG